MRGKLVGKAFSSVSKQACMRNDPKKYGERWVGKVILTGKGTTGGKYFRRRKPLLLSAQMFKLPSL